LKDLMRTTLTALLCTTACSLSYAIELAAYPKVFTGPEGAEVVLAPTADGKAALFRISGVNHPVDKVVFLGQLQRWGGSTDAFVTTYDGRDSGMVQKKGSAYGGGDRYVAYLPGRKQELDLAFDEKKSKALKSAELLAAYADRTSRVSRKSSRASTVKRAWPTVANGWRRLTKKLAPPAVCR